MRVLWITFFTILADQATKIVVLRTMSRGQSIPLIGDWLKLTFTENPGMAFGITFGPKALVTVFSMIATVLIIFYLVRVRDGYLPYRASLAFILGGALGNIIDRVFYGVLLGYETFFVGRVVDFIHVNLWSGLVPDVVPLIGGTYISLFPIWNVADMAIVCGVVGILLFQHTYHEQLLGTHQGDASGSPASAPATADASVPPVVAGPTAAFDGTTAPDSSVPKGSIPADEARENEMREIEVREEEEIRDDPSKASS